MNQSNNQYYALELNYWSSLKCTCTQTRSIQMHRITPTGQRITVRLQVTKKAILLRYQMLATQIQQIIIIVHT